MVEAFAMMAGTALEYGVRMLACLQTERKKESNRIPLSGCLLLVLQPLTYISCSLPLFSDIPKGHRGSRISQNVPAAAHGRLNPAVHVCGCNFFFRMSVKKGAKLRNDTPVYCESQWMQMWKPGSAEDIWVTACCMSLIRGPLTSSWCSLI